MSNNKIIIGKILKSHGVKGEAVLLSYSGAFKYDSYEEFFIKEGDQYKKIIFTMSRQNQGKKNLFIVTIDSISREDINTYYGGEEVYVDSLNYNNLKEDEFFFNDLLESSVFIEGELKGKVIGVFNFGSHDVVQVKLLDVNKKGNEQSVFFPLQEGFLVEMKIESKELYFKDVENFI